MIENNPFWSPRIDPAHSDMFPVFTRAHIPSDNGNPDNDLTSPDFQYETGYTCTAVFAKELIVKLRQAGEQAEVQHHDIVPLTPKTEPKPLKNGTAPTTAPIGSLNSPAKKKNKNDTNDHQILINRLSKQPHIIEFKGAVLDRNERLKIIAAVAMCESGDDPFGAENTDQEFVGRKNALKGIETGYSRIVHIGLSYGVIQFTQDGGALGGVLQKCNEKNPQKFVDVFGDNWQQLLTLTTVGIHVPGVDYLSGLDHWHAIAKTKEGTDTLAKASASKLPVSGEIRGTRVQPIAVNVGGMKQDLWEGTWKKRFKDAAQVPEFQEAQLIYAVESYLNPTLPFCKTHNVRSGLGIAFAVACRVRGANPQLLLEAAKKKGLKVPFGSEADEKAAVVSISKGEIKDYQTTHKGKTKTAKVAGEEITRAERLTKDSTGFLEEDMYWTDTFDNDHDK